MVGAELIAIISVSGSVLATLITTIFTSMSLSRCKNISCCYACILCDREVVKDEIVAQALENNNT